MCCLTVKKVIAVYIGILLIALCNAALATNVLDNPGFESGTAPWTTWAWGEDSIEATSLQKHSGQSSCLSANRTAYWNGPVQSMLGRMIPGTQYNVSAWAMLASSGPELVTMCFHYRIGETDSYVAASPSVWISDEGWTLLTGSFAVPDEPLTALNLYVAGPPSGTSFYLDDVVVDGDLLNQQVQVDLSSVTRPVSYRASGFLFGFSATEPGVGLFEALKPRLCRVRACTQGLANWGDGTGFTSPAFMSRIRNAGAKAQIILSDEYMWEFGYHDSWGWPGDVAHDGYGPYDLLDRTIEAIYGRAVENGYEIEWDVWNEPDNYDPSINAFWGRSQEQFFDCWKHAYNKIRSLDPYAVIVGPSAAFFTPVSGTPGQYVLAFLQFCKDNDCLPSVVSWHANYPGAYKDIPGQVSLIRGWIHDNGLAEMPIDINEFVAPTEVTKPGVYPWYFAGMEEAMIRGAAHACWDDDDGRNTYVAGRLDGIMTSGLPHAPRAAWRCYKAYGDMSGSLVAVAPGTTIAGVASSDAGTGKVTVLLGNDSSATVHANLLISHVDGVSRLTRFGDTHMVVDRIRDTAWSATPLTDIVSDAIVAPDSNTLSLPMTFEPYSAYVVAVSPPRFSLSGRVSLDGYSWGTSTVPVTIELRDRDGRTHSKIVDIDRKGDYRVAVARQGIYSVSFSSPGWQTRTFRRVWVRGTTAHVSVKLVRP